MMTPEERFWGNVSKECWVWLGTRRWDGYGRLTFKNKQTTANRVAWELANGRPVPPGMHVLHRCDVPACCNPAHLYIGTHQENMLDAKHKKRSTVGERNWSAKLTEAQVREIWANPPKLGRPGKLGSSNIQEYVKRYGVRANTIQAIINGRAWNNVTGLPCTRAKPEGRGA